MPPRRQLGRRTGSRNTRTAPAVILLTAATVAAVAVLALAACTSLALASDAPASASGLLPGEGQQQVPELQRAAPVGGDAVVAPNDYDNYHYFAVQLHPAAIAAALEQDVGHPHLDHFDHRLNRRAIAFHGRAEEIAAEAGVVFLGRVGALHDYFQFAVPRTQPRTPESLEGEAKSSDQPPDAGAALARFLEDHPDIVWAEQQIPKRRLFKRIPPSPPEPDLRSGHQQRRKEKQEPSSTFASELVKKAIENHGISDPLFPRQWHLYAEGSYDYNDHVKLPMPNTFEDRHGTRCAGEVVATKNDICGVGIAFKAKVSGVRILSGPLTEVDEAAAINYDMQNNLIFSCSWGPADNGMAMEAPPKIVVDAFYNGIVNGRGGLGAIYVFASGNGGAFHDNCNFDGYTNSIYTVTVSSIDRKNNHPAYSEMCSANLVVTYSSATVRSDESI
ncbi:pheromone processing endoprotease, partial [Cladochytrium tenue]